MTHSWSSKKEILNEKVATVDANGKIKAKGKDSATIYVYAKNGLVKKVKVKVN